MTSPPPKHGPGLPPPPPVPPPPVPPPLGLYVHLPWCLRKCPYCDFNSHVAASAGADGAVLDAPTQRRYIQALLGDLEASLPLIWGRPVRSIFFGGGTPSLFAPEAIDQLLGALRARLRLAPDCEITLEANPGTLETARLRAFAQAGVTRLSVGVQSFDDDCLARIGRVHDARQAHQAVESAAQWFDTFNLDLMYALPGQTLAQLDADLRHALAHQPPHLSIYHLSIEANTAFAKFPPTLPHQDLAWAMLDQITERSTQAGLARYEVSAYARAGHTCRHNLNYWQFGDYLGIGAGAHGKISRVPPQRTAAHAANAGIRTAQAIRGGVAGLATTADDGASIRPLKHDATLAHHIIRQRRYRDPNLYMQHALQGQAVTEERQVPCADLPFEFMLNALRLKNGFALGDFFERTGLPLSSIEATLQAAQRKGWLARDLTRAWPTEKGFDFLSDLQMLFLPD